MSRFFFPPEIKSRNFLQFLNSFYKVKNLTCPNSLPKIRIKKSDIFVSQVNQRGFAASFGTNRGKFVQQKPKTPVAIFVVFCFTLKYCVADGKSAKALLQEWQSIFEREEKQCARNLDSRSEIFVVSPLHQRHSSRKRL